MRSAIVAATLIGACVPTLDVDSTRVRASELIAVRAEPPEVTPGVTRVRFTALVASPTTSQPTLRWAFCALPRGEADTRATSAECLTDGPAITPFAATGSSVDAVLPSDACRTVGPEAPPIGPSMVLRRPPAPDVTGGYYIPVRVTLDASDAYQIAFARVRIRCARPDVPTDVARDFDARFVANRNPSLASVSLLRDGRAERLAADGGEAAAVRAGERVELEVELSDDSAERYARIERDGSRVVDDVERLEVSWFSDVGSFSEARSLIAAGATRACETLTIARDALARGAVWVIVRDGRGGVAFGAFSLRVTR